MRARQGDGRRGTRWVALGAAVFCLVALGAARVSDAAPDFSGVWAMVQHDRLGAPFFIPVEPKLNATGKAATAAFVAKYDVKNNEANANCVEPGMPTVMWGIGGAAMEIVQQPQRITLLSELENQSRRIYLDGRKPPDSFPDQRVGFSVGHWEGDTLVIETTKVTEWQAPRWPHSGAFRVTERWRLEDPAKLKLTGLRPGGPPLKIEGQVLVNEMTMNDPLWYEDKDYKVTVYYRKIDDYVLEDNCPEGTWMERLEALAKKGNPPKN
ncbi:MAG TPA: hypothetical protein VHH11_08170 [Gammaproteobacteria bacterium]|jgi:hypothetical protein|nr:hypothetical protein [Gammaproteobacteria bacterium]